MEFGYNIRENWNIDFENVTFLNNGSFGATPKIVLDKMSEIEFLTEREPVQFFMSIYPQLMNENLSTLARFLNTNSDNLAFTDNATSGVNTILKSLMFDLDSNDEIIYVNHIYPAIRNTINYICSKRNIKSREITINFPDVDKQNILDSLQSSFRNETKLLVIDHISSPTALVFPIKEIIELCHKSNILVLVDGAHAPGMVDLNLSELNADWYVGNCHKWLFAGKGCAFIHTSVDRFNNMQPLITSNDYGRGYRKEFDWTGTRNSSPWLSLNTAIKFYELLGRNNIDSYNKNLLKETANLFLETFELNYKLRLENFGYIISLPFPYVKEFNYETPMKLRNFFYENYGIEVMFSYFNNQIWIRYSAQVYNTITESKILIEKIQEFRKSEF